MGGVLLSGGGARTLGAHGVLDNIPNPQMLTKGPVMSWASDHKRDITIRNEETSGLTLHMQQLQKAVPSLFRLFLLHLQVLSQLINLRILRSVLCQQGPNAAEWRDRGENCIRTIVSLIQRLSGPPSSPGEVYADVVEHHGADVI